MDTKTDEQYLDEADRIVEKLLAAPQEDLRIPREEAQKIGGLLKDLLADVRANTGRTAKEDA